MKRLGKTLWKGVKMDRLDELVKKNPTLQRLRDVSCQLMLGNRQQEELVNYVAGMFYNMRYCYGGIYSLTPDGAENAGSKYLISANYGYPPVLKDVKPLQGSFSCTLLGYKDFYSVPEYLELPDFVAFKKGRLGRCVFVGFVSDVLGRGVIRVDGVNEVPNYTCFARPFTFMGYDGVYKSFYQKLTDTTPILCEDGRIYFDMFALESRKDVLSIDGVLLRGDFSFSFNYVGLAICFGGETGSAPVVVPLNLGGSETPASGGSETLASGGSETPATL